MAHRVRSRRTALSFLELLAVVVILGILAGLIVPRFGKQSFEAKKRSCHVYRGQIEVQAQLWYKATGRWPASDLSDIARDATYFPDGLPVCPVDGSAYRLDSSTGQVVGHAH